MLRNGLFALLFLLIAVGVVVYWVGENPGDPARLTSGPDPSPATTETSSTEFESPSVESTVAPAAVGLRGVVVDRHTGVAIGDAKVALEVIHRGSRGDRVASVRTDANGAFRLDPHPAGNNGWRLHVESPGYLAFTQRIARPMPPDHEFRIELDPGFGVTGRVVDSAGGPVGGGEIRVSRGLAARMSQEPPVRVIYRGDSAETYSIREDGTFHALIDARLARLEADVPGFAPAVSPVIAGPYPEPLVLVVDEGDTLTGRAVEVTEDGETRGVEGATVVATPALRTDRDPDRSVRRYGSRRRATSGADGSFAVAGLTKEASSVVVTHPEYTTRRLQSVDVAAPLEVELTPALWVVGRLVDDGVPVANCRFNLTGEGGTRTANETVVTDGQGRFRSPALTSKTTKVKVAVPGYFEVEREWDAGSGERDLGDVSLERGPEVIVRVIDAQSLPVVGAPVLIGPTGRPFRRWTQLFGVGATGLDGRCAVPVVAPGGGDMRLEVDKPGFYRHQQSLASPANSDAESPEEVTPVEWVVELRPESHLNGRFVRGQEPIGGAYYELFDLNEFHADSFPKSVATGISSPEGRFATEVRGGELHFLLRIVEGSGATTEFEVRDLSTGERRDLGDVELNPGRAITGVVVDETGVGIPGAFVAWATGNYDPNQGVTADAHGGFRIEGAEVGSYRLRASAHSHLPGDLLTVRVAEDREPDEVRLELTRGVVRAGRVVDVDGVGIRGANVWVITDGVAGRRNSVRTGADGQFEVTLRDDGAPLSIEVSASQYLDHRERYDSVAHLPDMFTLSKGAGFRILFGERARDNASARLILTIRSPRGTHSYHQPISEEVYEATGFEPGTYEYEVRLSPYAAVSGQVELEADEIREIVYEPSESPSVTVEVVDQSGNPVVGAQLIRYRRTSSGSSGSDAGKTDPTGRCEVESLDEAGVDLAVHAPGFAPTYAKDVVDSVRGASLRVVLDSGAILLVVVRQADGSAAAGLDVDVHPTDSVTNFRSHRAKTDAEGRARIDSLPAGTVNVSVSREYKRLQQTETVTEPGVEKTLEIVLAARSEVTGTVSVNGKPAKSGQLQLSAEGVWETIPVAADGTFIGNVPDGEYELFHWTPDRVVVALGQRSVSGATRLDFDYRGFEVAIEIVTRPPASIERGHVRLTSIDDAGHSATVFLRNQPRLSFAALPTGRYRVTLEVSGSPFFARPLEIEVSGPGEFTYETEPVVTLEAPTSDGGVSARVELIDAAGDRQPLSVVGASPLRFVWPEGVAGDGVIWITDEPPRFFAVAADGTITPGDLPPVPGGDLSVRSSSDHPFFRLEPLGSTPGPVRFWEQFQRRVGRPLPLAAGRYRVIPVGDDAPAPKEVEIVVGQSTTVEF